MKVIFGASYINKWGDIRIPVRYDESGDKIAVVFIENKAETLFSYNPYKNTVTEVQFLKMFHLDNSFHVLSKKEVEELCSLVEDSDTKFHHLVVESTLSITKLLSNEHEI